MQLSCKFVTAALVFVLGVSAFHPTDSIQDADPGQSGYLPNHNIDSEIVDSEGFTRLFTRKFNDNEHFSAKPLAYTPFGGEQTILLASSQNWIRTTNATTGDILEARQVRRPFLAADVGCKGNGDIIRTHFPN